MLLMNTTTSVFVKKGAIINIFPMRKRPIWSYAQSYLLTDPFYVRASYWFLQAYYVWSHTGYPIAPLLGTNPTACQSPEPVKSSACHWKFYVLGSSPERDIFSDLWGYLIRCNHLKKSKDGCCILFVLRFYGPVNQMGSCRARSVYLTTHLLGRLSPLSG